MSDNTIIQEYTELHEKLEELNKQSKEIKAKIKDTELVFDKSIGTTKVQKNISNITQKVFEYIDESDTYVITIVKIER